MIDRILRTIERAAFFMLVVILCIKLLLPGIQQDISCQNPPAVFQATRFLEFRNTEGR